MTGRDDGRDGGPAKPATPREPEGGDNACWLDRVCPECGRFAEAVPPATCTGCGARVGDVD